MRSRHSRGSTLVLVLALMVLGRSYALGDYEVNYFIMDNYDIDSNCPRSNLGQEAMLAEYMDEMSAMGWDDTLRTTVYHSYFWDPTLVTNGLDYLYIDEGYVGFIGAHGAVNSSNEFLFRMNRYSAATNSCFVNPHDQMELGEPTDHIRFLHMTSCRSMHIDDNVHQSWREVFHGIHQIHGYHGLGWSASRLADDYGRFANDSHSSNMSSEWVNELYEQDEFYYSEENTYVDLCPVAYTGRDTEAACTTVLNNEKYPTPGQTNIVFADIDNPSVYKRRYIQGCDPAGGLPLD